MISKTKKPGSGEGDGGGPTAVLPPPADQHARGPAVADQVMGGEREPALVGAEAEQGGAGERTHADVERSLHLAAQVLARKVVTL